MSIFLDLPTPFVTNDPAVIRAKKLNQLRSMLQVLDIAELITIPAIYSGYVGADGSTGNDLPTGWSVNKSATGVYVITHSLALATATDMQIATNIAENAARVSYAVGGTNSFTVRTATVVPALADTAFNFIATIPRRNL